MGKNKVEYERVDGKADKYRRILVKFNPKFLRGSDFEIEFIPLAMGVGSGEIFVTEIDTMSTIDLYRWVDRQMCLRQGLDRDGRGTIISKKLNTDRATLMKRSWRQGRLKLEPRQIISRVKRLFEEVKAEFNEPVSFAYIHFLYSGELASLPYRDEVFNVEKLRKVLEVVPYRGFNAEGERVERPLVDHLFDTHKTEYLKDNILRFLKGMYEITRGAVEKYGKEILG